MASRFFNPSGPFMASGLGALALPDRWRTPSTGTSAATFEGYIRAYWRITGVPMLCPTNTILPAFASTRTASIDLANSSMVSGPFLGEPLLPWPGRSRVTTR